MKRVIFFLISLNLLFTGCGTESSRLTNDSGAGNIGLLLQSEKGSVINFFGNRDAELFSRELAESMQGVLKYNFVSVDSVFPIGFVHASPVPQGWSNTFWTRDGGTFLRELVHWNYIEHARFITKCLIKMVDKNENGFFSFPEYFDKDYPKSGDELDGTSSIIIGMVILYNRLSSEDPLKRIIYDFLHQPSSPVAYIQFQLKGKPLLMGEGEFGGGMGIPGYYCNVVQNNLSALALLAVSAMERQEGDILRADSLKIDAGRIFDNMQEYLVDADGSWIWCIDPVTMKVDTNITQAAVNRGFGGYNGVLSMYSDVCGFEPAGNKSIFEPSLATFLKLYNTPLRKDQFDKYGIWTQFDVFIGGLLTSPSYGQGYATQVMLLSDSIEMATKAVEFLARQTYQPLEGYVVHRNSPYYFYERMYSPEAPGKVKIEEGCGALNLVNVTEQLKVARLMIGIDDSDPDTLKLIPRIPSSWKGYIASGWPAYTGNGVSYLDIKYEIIGGIVNLKMKSTLPIKYLKVRVPSSEGWTWVTDENCDKMVVRYKY